MKGQAWAFLLVVWVAVWAWADGAQTRSSDPNTILSSINMLPPDLDIILGDSPGVAQDVLGPPLDPDDFAMVDQIAHDPVDNPITEDPTLRGRRFQGDIILQTRDELMNLIGGPVKGRSAIKDENKKWPNGVVPYVISSSYNANERSTIASAMRTISLNSCITFKHRTNEVNYIHIFPAGSCASSVGMIGGKQGVELGSGCVYKGVVMHELMHALGFWHEHSRFDRDKSIRILWSNIDQQYKYNFDKLNSTKSKTMGIPYDTGSILHYGPTAFAKKPDLTTIEPFNKYAAIGQRVALSKFDKKKLNMLYCDKSSTTATVATVAPAIKVPASCKDNSPNCKGWATMGECGVNPDYMVVECCRSCMTEEGCRDHSAKCPGWSKRGECTTNPDYMTFFCATSCGLCGSVNNGGGKVCKDEHPDCPGWAKTRQCIVNPKYMELKCKKSCKKC